MAKYITQMRRGTLEEWSTIWKDIIPLEGELVFEMDKSGANLHRMKIGDGLNVYAKLPYISVDNFVLPKPFVIALYENKWQQSADDRYYQEVTIPGAIITSNSKVDLQPSPEQLCYLRSEGISLSTENEDGVVRVYIVGETYLHDCTMQAIITEVLTEGVVYTHV